jgi:intracellular sulfur oxidation DsrE/DsrF family protein
MREAAEYAAMARQDDIVIHITSSETEDWRMALRNLQKLAENESVAANPESMHVVVNGGAVRFLLATTPEGDRIPRMAEAGVEIEACANSLERLGFSPAELAEGITVTDSGVAEVVRLQQRGYTYLKLP